LFEWFIDSRAFKFPISNQAITAKPKSLIDEILEEVQELKNRHIEEGEENKQEEVLSNQVKILRNFSHSSLARIDSRSLNRDMQLQHDL